MLRFLPLFLPLLIFLSSPASSKPQQGDVLFFPGFKASAANLTLDGAAGIRNNGLLRLTNDTSRLSGHAFYSSPVRFKNTSDGKVFSFSTAFVLAIVPEYPKLGGHGMAFTFATSPVLNALPSQYLGLLNATDVGNFTNHLLAVEFDTVQDFEFQDINDNHVGIDINSLVSNASAPVCYLADGSTKRNLTLKSGQPIQVWVDYDSAQNLLMVSISPDSSKPKKPLLSFPVDLSPIFDEFMYVGFSASTGLLASAHYIQGWSFKVNGEAQSLDLSSLPSLPRPKKKHTGLTIGVSVSSVILGIFVLALAIYLVYKIKDADPIEDWEMEIGPHRFSYGELKQATSNFSEKMILGHGGFGKVYGGKLPNSKTQIAVKRISHESKQGLHEFVSEITTIGRLRHRNLAQLVGWCRRRGDLLLVYEFMANGSLDRFIFGEARSVLNWERRFKIIKDVAAGLLYLHEGYEQVVIHRDVKASNVLVDNEMNGKLGDFGLAKLYEHGSTPGTTRVVGTLGYLAPELPRTGKATTSSDVYAFGALMLEVACGRRPIEPKARGEELVLVDWVWEMFREGKILEVVDLRLNGDYIESEMLVVLKLGLMCSNNAPSARPSMHQVLRCLDGEAEAGVPENLRARDDSGAEKGSGEGFDEFLNSLVSASFNDLSSYSFSRGGNGNGYGGYGSSYGGTSFASLSTSPFSVQHGSDTRYSD